MSEKTYAIPAGSKQRACRSCKAPIFWVRTDTGKPMPVNPDGSSHFGTCPEGKQWSGRKRKDGPAPIGEDPRNLKDADEINEASQELEPGGTWHKWPVLALDFESTSADPTEARPVGFASLYVLADGTLHSTSKHGIVDPGIEIPAEAIAVHGITNERVKQEGMSEDEAIATIIGDLSYAKAAGSAVVAYNARYDMTLLKTRAEELGYKVPDVHVIDPLILDRWTDKYRKGRRTLATACDLFGIELGDAAHDATADALAAAKLAYAIAKRYPMTQMRLEILTQKQAQVFEEWRVGYIAHKRKVDKNPDFDVTPGWPFEEPKGTIP